MTSSTDPGNKSPQEIERELDEERGRLHETAEALQDKLSIGSLIDQVMSRSQEGGGEFARNFGRTVRDNPVPMALIGVGLAWLMAGGQDATNRRDGALGRFTGDDDDFSSMSGDYRSRHLASSRDPRTGIPRSGVDWDRREEEIEVHVERREGEDDDSYRERVREARDSAHERMRSAAGSVRDSASSAAGSVRDSASSAAGSVRDGARSAGQSMSRAQREAYYRAQHYGRRGAATFDRMVEEQPLVMGALAVALGAAVGGLAPNSRAENRMMGEYAERVRGEAADVMADEAQRARRVAEAAADEATSMADEAAARADSDTPDGRSAVQKAENKAREAASRIGERAQEEAERQDLGGRAQKEAERKDPTSSSGA